MNTRSRPLSTDMPETTSAFEQGQVILCAPQAGPGVPVGGSATFIDRGEHASERIFDT